MPKGNAPGVAGGWLAGLRSASLSFMLLVKSCDSLQTKIQPSADTDMLAESIELLIVSKCGYYSLAIASELYSSYQLRVTSHLSKAFTRVKIINPQYFICTGNRCIYLVLIKVSISEIEVGYTSRIQRDFQNFTCINIGLV